MIRQNRSRWTPVWVVIGITGLGASTLHCQPAPGSSGVSEPAPRPTTKVVHADLPSEPAAAPPASSPAPTPTAPPPPPPLPAAPMVTIAAGPFTMGCPRKAASLCRHDERPAHRVTLSEYLIDVYEVEVRYYKECLDAGVCEDPRSSIRDARDLPSNGKVCVDQFNADASHLPIICVTRYQAEAYCAWRGKRLPTEAEWEKAARADDERLFPWGDDSPTADLACMQRDKPCEVGTHPRGATPLGVHDMAGNAAEWVGDWYHPRYYATSPLLDPPGYSTDLLPIQDQPCMAPRCNIARGGRFDDPPMNLRSTARATQFNISALWTQIGFRCVKSEISPEPDH